METSSHFIAVLDTCVLYPAPIRDLLLYCAVEKLYMPKWSADILKEIRSTFKKQRPDIPQKAVEFLLHDMVSHFGEANVTGYKKLIPAMDLPDPKDNHVLATAVRCNAAVIVTFNLRDFPKRKLNPYHIEVQHPDEFCQNMLDIQPGRFLEAFLSQVEKLKNPPKTPDEVINSLFKCGLLKTAKGLGNLIN